LLAITAYYREAEEKIALLKNSFSANWKCVWQLKFFL